MNYLANVSMRLLDKLQSIAWKEGLYWLESEMIYTKLLNHTRDYIMVQSHLVSKNN